MKKLLLFLFLMTISLGQSQGSAPTPPARNAWDVVSVFSGAYSDVSGTGFYPDWGQGTLYAQEDLGGGNMALHYSNLDYQGTDFTPPLVLSNMTHLHLDMYSTDITSINYYLIGGGENSVTLTLVSGWNSFDIPLTSYAARTLNSIPQIKFEKVGFAYHGETNSVYIDNMYFYRPATSLPPPTISGFTVASQVVGASSFNLTAPTSNSAGAFTYTSSNTSVATISGSTVTVVGAGSSSITANQAATGSYGAGSTSATLDVTPPAATTPSNAAADVISVFSNAYTDAAGTNFYPNWGQSTQYSLLDIGGNATIKYSNLNYQGIQLAAPIDASAMQNLHIDIWTPDCTSFQIYLINQGIGEQGITVTPSLSGWNSYDIPLSSYNTVNKANIGQFKFVGSGTVFLDNIYFWKLPAGSASYYVDADNDGYGAGVATISTTPIAGSVTNNTDCNDGNAAIHPGATEVLNSIDDDCDGLTDEGLLPTIPATDAPTPIARNAWDVQSVYSAAYANYAGVDFFPNWGQSTTFSNYTPVSDETIKYSDLTYQGIDFNGSKNISAMTKLHLDVWTPEITSLQISLIAGGENAVTLTPTLSGWNSFDIDLASQYAGRNLTAAIQLKLERVGGGTSSLFLDNIYFYRPATTQPPTLGAFTVPAKVVGDASFALTAPTSNSAGAFSYSSSNTAVATISGTTVTIVGAGSSTITATQAAAGPYGEISVIATLEVSLAAAAPTPTVPGDRVLSVFSDGAGYSNAAGTNFYPNWGQSTQYSLTNVLGNPTLKYSNLNYQGIQLASVLDVTTYTNLHIDVYGAGTSSVDFRVINQVGGAGSPDLEHIANTALTLTPGVWNSFDIPVASLSNLELNRIGQFMFVGSGTIYVDNIYFSKPTPTAVAPTVANISFCKGSVSALTAIPSGNNPLKWYTAASGGTALASAPIPTATKTYYVAQVMSDATVSARAVITATINALPATPTALVSSESKLICKYIGSATPVTFDATAVGAVSYIWTVPAGASKVSGDGTASVGVSFAGASTTTPGVIGSVTVKSVGSNGCASLAKALVLTTKLPTSPASLTLTSADTALDFDVLTIPTSLSSLAKITKVGPYAGTATVFTLNAPAAVTAASYAWTLPSGVNQLSGGTTNSITVNFAGVTAGTSAIPVVVQSVGGCGSSTNRTLTLSRVVPKSPSKLVLTDGATILTKVGPYTGKSTVLTLTGTPVRVQGVTSTSYAWILPAGVTCLTASTPTTIYLNENLGTVEVPNIVPVAYAAKSTATSTITINLAGVASGVTSLAFKVFGVNGSGNSTAKTLTVTAAVPATPAIVASPSTTFNTCSTRTYTATSIPGATYNWTVPNGASIVGGPTTGNVIEVSFGSVVISASYAITCSATNGTGTSGIKSLTIKKAASCIKIANSATANEYKVSAYPNPSSSEFTIETSRKGATSVEVYDMQGRLIENRKANSNTVQVGAKLAAGTYNVMVRQDANVKTVRVIKN